MAQGKVGVKSSVARLVSRVRKYPKLWELVEVELRHCQQLAAVLDEGGRAASAPMHKVFLDEMTKVRNRIDQHQEYITESEGDDGSSLAKLRLLAGGS